MSRGPTGKRMGWVGPAPPGLRVGASVDRRYVPRVQDYGRGDRPRLVERYPDG